MYNETQRVLNEDLSGNQCFPMVDPFGTNLNHISAKSLRSTFGDFTEIWFIFGVYSEGRGWESIIIDSNIFANYMILYMAEISKVTSE